MAIQIKKHVSEIIAYFLALVFLLAGISKLINFTDFHLLLVKLEIFPKSIIPYIAFFLIVTELTVGTSLIKKICALMQHCLQVVY